MEKLYPIGHWYVLPTAGIAPWWQVAALSFYTECPSRDKKEKNVKEEKKNLLILTEDEKLQL